jgi:hypothetical protein
MGAVFFLLTLLTNILEAKFLSNPARQSKIDSLFNIIYCSACHRCYSMGSTYTSPQGSMNGSILSVNSGSSSGSKSRSIASSNARVSSNALEICKGFMNSKPTPLSIFAFLFQSLSDREPLHEDEEVESHLQVELKSLIQSHEHLGKQASSLGEELAQTRAEALALKTQLEDATSKLTPSPTKAPLSPVEAPSFSSEVVGSLFGQVGSPSIHEAEEVLALKTQIDLLATDITKDETLKLLEAADSLRAQAESDLQKTLVLETAKEAEIDEAKHCMEPIQSDKDDALVVAAATASDAKLLAIRCAALEFTVQRLMEGLENKSSKDSAKKSPSGGIHTTCSQLSEASDCEAKLQVSADSATTEGVDATSIEVTGPLSAGLDASSNDVSETQKAPIKFLGTIGAVRPCNNIAATGDNGDGDGAEQQRSRLSVVGNGRIYGNTNNNRFTTAPGAHKTNKLVMVNPSRSSSAAGTNAASEKKTASSTKKNTNTFFQKIGIIMKNNAVSLVVKGTAGLILLGVVSRLVRGCGGRRGRGSTAKAKGRSFQSRHYPTVGHPADLSF